MNCPCCETELTTQTIDDLELDLCPGCGGVWFDPKELHAAQEKADADLAWIDFDLFADEAEADLSPGRTCPRCVKGMCAVEYADTGVRVDACPDCHGVWLDRSDFPRIVKRLEKEVHELSSGELFKASLHEALEILAHPTRLVSEWRDLRSVLGLLGKRLLLENPALARRLSQAPRGTPFS